MRKLAIAEFILSCTMSRERAGAAAGDLAETSRGLSFWTSVGHLAFAASFRSMAQTPVRLILMALLLWFMFLLVSASYAFGAWLLWMLFYLAGNHTALELVLDRLGWTVPLVPPAWLSLLFGLVLLPAAAAWKIGAGVSRKSPGSELVSWYAIVVVWGALGV